MPAIATKNVREKASRGDGRRVLVMALWPRGVKKSALDDWYKDLGTPKPLLRAWKGGKIGWAEYRRRYFEHLKTLEAKKAFGELAKAARQGKVTLLCSCPDANRCHRSLLQKELQKQVRRRR